MNSSYVRTLLTDIAKKIGRNPQELEPFIKRFEQQWYDSKDALQKLTLNDYQRMQIPQRLAKMIMEEVGPQQRQYMQEKMDVESPVQGYLTIIQPKLSSSDFQIIVTTLHKIFHNIRSELMNEKFRVLKKSNQKIAILSSVPEIAKILKYGGFQDTRHTFEMSKVNIVTIDECIDGISKFMPKSTFNPYSSHIITNGSTRVEQYQGKSSTEFNQRLEELERERVRIMSQPIQDRKIRVYQVEPQFQKEFDRQFQEERQAEDVEKFMDMENLRILLKKQAEEPKFMNRREQEYHELVKQPVFSEALIRVKLPQNGIFECKVSPMETLQVLVDIFRQCLNYPNLDYYLYMTPPVQKLSGMLLRKTFYDLGCVPRSVFYMKCEEEIKGTLFKIGVTHKKF